MAYLNESLSKKPGGGGTIETFTFTNISQRELRGFDTHENSKGANLNSLILIFEEV